MSHREVSVAFERSAMFAGFAIAAAGSVIVRGLLRNLDLRLIRRLQRGVGLGQIVLLERLKLWATSSVSRFSASMRANW